MIHSFKLPLFAGLLGFACAAPASLSLAGSPLQIELEGEFNASKADVRKLLHSTAAPLWRQFPDRDLSTIKVGAKGGPIVWHKRGPAGQYTVRLNTGEQYWAQYAYQFSHEFTHILANYRRGGDHNKWFEEALAELGSIWTMRQMAEDWKTKPPYPNWKSYGTHLHKYAQDLIDKTKVPDDLAAWYKENKAELEKAADNRPLNRVVAVALLPMFEKEPELWQSIASLNKLRGEERGSATFEQYLQAWHDHAPAKFGERIREIATRLGIELVEANRDPEEFRERKRLKE